MARACRVKVCGATTKRGTKCSLCVADGGTHCRWHRQGASRVRAKPKPQQPKKATGVTKVTKSSLTSYPYSRRTVVPDKVWSG